MSLIEKIEDRSAVVGIVGLGYVGLPLAVAFAEAGFRVKGIDIDEEKVAAVNRQVSYIEDISSETLRSLEVPIEATADYAVLAECDTVSICVPTPLSKTGDPDVSYIISAADEVARYLHPGMLVVLESTTYPGTTSEILLPRLAGNGDGLKVGEDFFLCFSPERVDPGREDWTTRNTPKVIGGTTERCLEMGKTLYGAALETLVPVSSTEAAEMVKIYENTFRAVNIAMANEVLLMCEKLNLNVWEVIEAAATKPFGFMKFTPGPGIGGHCIPIDPLYLSWKLKSLKFTARIIDLADEINSAMPAHWVQKVQDALNEVGKPVRGSEVLILGVSYKPNVGDLRESPALDIIHLLWEKGARVRYHDPYVPRFNHDDLEMVSVEDSGEALARALAHADCVVIVTDHAAYDWSIVRERARLVVDTRNALGKGKNV
ncbi:MAG: nucleotide sugar dehydrogenase [Anaerolineae bacterium]